MPTTVDKINALLKSPSPKNEGDKSDVDKINALLSSESEPTTFDFDSLRATADPDEVARSAAHRGRDIAPPKRYGGAVPPLFRLAFDTTRGSIVEPSGL